MVNSAADPVEEVVSALSGSRSAELVRRFEHGAGSTSLVQLDGRTVVLKAWRMHVMRGKGVPIPELLEQGARVPADALGTYVAIYAVRYASWAIASTMEREVLSLCVRLVAETTDA